METQAKETTHTTQPATDVNGSPEIPHDYIQEHIQEHIDEQEYAREYVFNMYQKIVDQMDESNSETDKRINQINKRMNEGFRRVDVLAEHIIDLLMGMKSDTKN